MRIVIKFTLLLIFFSTLTGCSNLTNTNEFSGERALQDVEYQVNLGPRIPGEEAHYILVEWIILNLEENAWEVELQEIDLQGQRIRNVVAKRGSAEEKILLGAHYDTRIFADNDPDPTKRNSPVPGANDGASGVAVLLELARVLPQDIDKEIYLVFFDAEDNGRIPGWDWVLGSRAFVQNLEVNLNAVVIVDMVGDADLNLYFEGNSSPELNQEIWSQAEDLAYSSFIPEIKYNILDDHTPFLQAGIPAVDIIDFDYPYWHTTADTLDKVSAESLHAVGDTLYHWLLNP